MITVDALTFTYPGATRPALDRCNLTLEPGEIVLVTGPSGSGKSTLLRCLNGLIPHFHGGRLAGQVRVFGRDPFAVGPRGMSDLVGFVFQNPEDQFVTVQVEDELAFALENAALEPREMRRRIDEVVERLSMEHLRQRRVSTLSGGERQRVALASVLTLRPRVLVLDEPTSQLDPESAAEVLDTLEDLHRQLELTVVISEHRLDRLAHRVHRVCRLVSGEPPEAGEPREVLGRHPEGLPMAQLAACVPELGGGAVPLTVEEARPWAGEFSRRLAEEPRRVSSILPGEPSAPAEPALLAGGGLRFAYTAGEEALRGVSLEIRAGERVALLGANGAGKTTLLKLLMGVLRPSAGRVELAGKDLDGMDLAQVARRVGFVPQNPGRLLFQETLAEEVTFTRRAHGLAEKDPGELLAPFGLESLAGAYPRDLSTGERQRAALAAVLAGEPSVLLLDEPTRGMDEEAKEGLRTLLERLSAQGTAVVVATHDVELAGRFAERGLLLERGKLAADGPLGEVLAAHPAFAPQVLQLLGDPSLLSVGAVAARLDRRGGEA